MYDFEDELRGDDDMKITEGRDPWAIGGIVLSIIVQIAGLSWIAGKFDQRMLNMEKEVAELKQKSGKDAEQDVQIAVIGAQLSTISTNVGEIKARLEQRR